jgi:hypothetical protein
MTVMVVIVIGVVMAFVVVMVVAMIVCLFHKCIFICSHPWPEQRCRSLCNR